MGLPPFFDKALQSTAAVIAGHKPSALRSRLLDCRVAIAIDEQSCRTRDGVRGQELAADLLSRLYAAVDIVALSQGNLVLAQRENLRNRVIAVNPQADCRVDVTDQTAAVLVFGVTAIANPRNSVVIYIGSDEWYALVGSRPQRTTDSSNPFGIGVATCIGASNVFRAVFYEELGHPQFDTNLVLDVLNFEIVPSAPDRPSMAPISSIIHLGESFLIGLGAVGHGASWALERVPGLEGMLHLIDGESYDDTNPQRYVQLILGDASAKVDRCAMRISAAHKRLNVVPHSLSWDEFLTQRGNWNLERVAVAVDSADDRRLIQSSLPRFVVNAWTQPSNVGVSRHNFVTSACLACLYMPTGEVEHFDRLVARQLKFQGEAAVREVRERLDTAHPLTGEFVGRIETQVGVPPGALSEFVGAPLSVLYQRAACGGLVLSMGGELGGFEAQAEVPMAFQSALAGIMLAVEMISTGTPLRVGSLPVRTEINLLRSITGTLNSPATKDMTGRCVCADPDFVSEYNSKYAHS